MIGFFTSLRLTVVLLALAIVLVFVGTLAQVDEGLYNAQARYFRQWFVFGVDAFGHHVPLLLPGGYLIGTMLVLNLVAAHVYRFQLSTKKIGIQIVHAGVILLLVGQLATDMLAKESQMRFSEGQSKSYTESARESELAFTTTDAQGGDAVVTIPGRLLEASTEIQDGNLPFAIRIKEYWPNSEAQFRAPMMKNGPPLVPNGIATSFDFHPAGETKSMDEKNVPTALIEIIGPKGSLGQWVISGWAADEEVIESMRRGYEVQLGAQMATNVVSQLTRPQAVDVEGKSYSFALRPKRIYYPFSLKLLKATHTIYEGTEIPKDFRSRVQLRNAQTGEYREIEISMNHPLRYAGLAFYQQQMDAGEAARLAGRTPLSVLQVVKNPGWLTPYIGCAMVAIGLVVQFLFHLTSFMSKRRSE